MTSLGYHGEWLRYDTIWSRFALEIWQTSCQFNLAHKLQNELF